MGVGSCPEKKSMDDEEEFKLELKAYEVSEWAGPWQLYESSHAQSWAPTAPASCPSVPLAPGLVCTTLSTVPLLAPTSNWPWKMMGLVDLTKDDGDEQ
jgi:hypothetical protein